MHSSYFYGTESSLEAGGELLSGHVLPAADEDCSIWLLGPVTELKAGGWGTRGWCVASVTAAAGFYPHQSSSQDTEGSSLCPCCKGFKLQDLCAALITSALRAGGVCTPATRSSAMPVTSLNWSLVLLVSEKNIELGAT